LTFPCQFGVLQDYYIFRVFQQLWHTAWPSTTVSTFLERNSLTISISQKVMIQNIGSNRHPIMSRYHIPFFLVLVIPTTWTTTLLPLHLGQISFWYMIFIKDKVIKAYFLTFPCQFGWLLWQTKFISHLYNTPYDINMLYYKLQSYFR
jgi:hypothetical protein